MTAHAVLARPAAGGQYQIIYLHRGGTPPREQLAFLNAHYQGPEQVHRLFSLGNLSSIGRTTGSPVYVGPGIDPIEDAEIRERQCVAYARDYHQPNEARAHVVPTLQDAQAIDHRHLYLWSQDGWSHHHSNY